MWEPERDFGAVSDDASTVPRPPRPPRLVGLYRDLWDDDGTALGWEVVAWAVVHGSGHVVTVPVEGVVSATTWLTLDDACKELEAQVCEVRPRPYAQWWRGEP